MLRCSVNHFHRQFPKYNLKMSVPTWLSLVLEFRSQNFLALTGPDARDLLLFTLVVIVAPSAVPHRSLHLPFPRKSEERFKGEHSICWFKTMIIFFFVVAKYCNPPLPLLLSLNNPVSLLVDVGNRIFFFTLGLWSWSNKTVWAGVSKCFLKAVFLNRTFSELKDSLKITKSVFLQVHNWGSEKLEELPRGHKQGQSHSASFHMWA